MASLSRDGLISTSLVSGTFSEPLSIADVIYYFLYVSCAFGGSGRVEECNKKSQLFDWCHLFLP